MGETGDICKICEFKNAVMPLNIYERRVEFARNVSMDDKEWLYSLDRVIICEKRGGVIAK